MPAQGKLHVSHRPDSFQQMPPQMWTKLRPGVRDFLSAAAELFELHICTMGDRQYAEQMGQLLDPCRCLFADRIISSVRPLSHKMHPNVSKCIIEHRTCSDCLVSSAADIREAC